MGFFGQAKSALNAAVWPATQNPKHTTPNGADGPLRGMLRGENHAAQSPPYRAQLGRIHAANAP